MAFDYFDYAAATPLDDDVLRAMRPYFAKKFFNPSATYGPAREVAADLHEARAKVAHWLGARPSEVVFTAGGTEANNLAIHGVMQSAVAGLAMPADTANAGRLTTGSGPAHPVNIVVSAIEHDSVLQAAARYNIRRAAVTAEGSVDIDDLLSKVDDYTLLVSVMYANNEVGTIQPIREIAVRLAAVRDERRKKGNALPLYFHTDACQAAQYLDLHVARLGVDLLTLNGGKIYGPKQSGVLYVRGGLELQSLIDGGGQEKGMRSGTENIAANIGLAAALDAAQSRRHEETARLQLVQQYFMDQIEAKLGGHGAMVNGSLRKRLPNNVHLTLPGTDNERVLLQLEAAGILAAAGSACSASSQEPSHVLKAMGCEDAYAQASLRFSMGRGTDVAGVERAVAALAGIAQSRN
jgi:cysteine desulfurase